LSTTNGGDDLEALEPRATLTSAPEEAYWPVSE